MSSLIFCTDENQAIIATDTLATDKEGTPRYFTSKTIVIPHIGLIIAGTGAAGFTDKWLVIVNKMVIRGIDNLNYHTPSILNSLWVDFNKPFGTLIGTTTIYHFGFSEEIGLMKAFAYRSTNNFISEPLQYGLAVKPECDIPNNYKLPDDFIPMMIDQRVKQNALPFEKRLFIGGEIQVFHLTKSGYSIYKIHQFEDYQSNLNEIFINCNKKQP